MATQGLVTVKSHDTVVMKIVAGINGYNAQEVADKIKKSWPLSTEAAYEIAKMIGFGSTECLVVMSASEIKYDGGEEIDPRYRKTFNQPEFNPRWERGTADYVVIIDV